jgi:HlyD family secretion protein
VDAQVAAQDVEGLSVGHAVKVRLASLHGRLTRPSADALTDEKRDRFYSSASVFVPQSELDRLRGRGVDLKPGMPADITITLKKRTALQSMINPLVQTFAGAFHER